MNPLTISDNPKFTHTDNAASYISSVGAILLDYLVGRALCHFNMAGKTAQSRFSCVASGELEVPIAIPFGSNTHNKTEKALSYCHHWKLVGTLHTYDQVQQDLQSLEKHSLKTVPREKTLACQKSLHQNQSHYN